MYRNNEKVHVDLVHGDSTAPLSHAYPHRPVKHIHNTNYSTSMTIA